MHETHAKFIAWAAQYDTADATRRSRQHHEQRLATLPCSILRLEGTGTVDEHLDAVMHRLGRC